MRRHIARVDISLDVLAEVLLVPDGVRLIEARIEDARYLRLLCEHPLLTGVEEGDEIPILSPVYIKRFENDVETISAEWL